MWTWILSDAPYQPSTNSVVPANASLGGHSAVIDADAPLTDRDGAPAEAAADSTDSTDSPSPSPSGTLPACFTQPVQTSTPSEGVYAATTPWVMKTPSMSLYGLTFNGVATVQVWDPTAQPPQYVDEKVLDFTASTLTIDSMVTYSIQSGSATGSYDTVYNDAGSGTVTTLQNVHMMTVSLSGSLFGLLPQQYTPTNLPPLPEHVDLGDILPFPIVFTDATVQLAYLNTASIDVPGFAGNASPGVASPQ